MFVSFADSAPRSFDTMTRTAAEARQQTAAETRPSEPETAQEEFGLISADVSASTIVLCLLGGLGIFLLGMKQISDGLQAVAGPRMRRLVAAATSNRIAGVLTGTVVTAIIQSSSVTTVMVVGMVTSGIMTLLQAINVIIGANIGTTATAWLVASFPKIGIAAIMGIIGAASVVYLFAKRESWKYLGLIFLGLGLIFFGLEFMNGSMSPISGSDGLREAMGLFSAVDASGSFTVFGMFKCILVGTVATAIVQSSSATTGIAIILVTTGSISFYTAATLVLGMNIGTTVTAWLAALGAPTNARRAALAHTLFNLIGVAVMTPFFPLMLPLIGSLFGLQNGLSDDPNRIAFAVAGVHTAFNVVNTCIFLPLVRPFAWCITRIIPDSKVRETPRLTVLNPRKLAPAVALEQARKEVEGMSRRCEEILLASRSVVEGTATHDTENDIFHAEEELDIVQHEVSSFLGIVITKNLPSDLANRARMLLRVADEYESVSDDIAAMLKQFVRLRRSGLELSAAGRTELLSLHGMCSDYALTVGEAFRSGKAHAADMLVHMHPDAAGISSRVKEIRRAQMTRMAEHAPDVDPLSVVVVLDVLNICRRLKNDCTNIGEAMLEEGR